MKVSAIDDYSTYLFHQGTNYNSYSLFGSHFVTQDHKNCVRFVVWAPHAQAVSVVGDFNNWDTKTNPMEKVQSGNGIWVAYIEDMKEGEIYKYAITTSSGEIQLKSDPYAFYAEVKPNTASKVCKLNYEWQDGTWMIGRRKYDSYRSPMLTYEMHLGSWRRDDEGNVLNYRDIAGKLVPYLKEMHYTHVEFMPLCEYPFDGSWGYQGTGYFAATSRYGTPQDLMYLIDQLHQNGIGVILDWVPGHYCKDAHGLRYFDGEPLYESGNPILAENKEWDTMNFDYGRTEVQSFLISSAMFWLTQFHLDGLRIDAVANMLYLSYGKKDGEWQPNKFGGRENLEAIDFLHKLNIAIFKEMPQALMIAEESSAWPMVTKPVSDGGLGFNYKWNMGWMNDMLEYMAMDPIYRKWNQNLITFSLCYAFSENFILPLSHDEVVHGKHSLLDKMPGDYWRKFAGLRAFYGYWMSHPGKKLLFMGSEYGQFIEWKYDDSLDWHLLDYPMHHAMHDYVRELNAFYNTHKEFWQEDCDWSGFNWISCDDTDNSVISFYRKGKDEHALTVVVCNFTPEVRYNYRIGVPKYGSYVEVFNSDAERFGGSNVLNEGSLQSQNVACHGLGQSLELRLPPLSTIYLRLEADNKLESIPTEAARIASMVISAEDKKKDQQVEKPAAVAVQLQPEPVEAAVKPKRRAARSGAKAKSQTAEAESAKTAEPAEPAEPAKPAKPRTRKRSVKAPKVETEVEAKTAEPVLTEKAKTSKTATARKARVPKTTSTTRTKAATKTAAAKTGKTAGATTRKKATKSTVSK